MTLCFKVKRTDKLAIYCTYPFYSLTSIITCILVGDAAGKIRNRLYRFDSVAVIAIVNPNRTNAVSGFIFSFKINLRCFKLNTKFRCTILMRKQQLTASNTNYVEQWVEKSKKKIHHRLLINTLNTMCNKIFNKKNVTEISKLKC